jgi:hypothetical protein
LATYPPDRSRRRVPLVETLEGRALMSGPAHALPTVRSALVHSVRTSIQVDPGGYAAIVNALNGGLGSEWVKLIHSEVHNLSSVIAGFISGKHTTYSIPGLTAKTPNVQPQFTGQPYDQLLANVAGVSVFKGNTLELGAIMRGPFHDPSPSYYVFALDRGAGTKLGPIFAGRPGITPDALVTLTVGPYGSSASGTINDLTTGSAQPIASSSIKINGPTIRVFLNTSQFPSKGLPIQKYRFAFWTQSQPSTDVSTVASFAPEASMDRIAVLKKVAATR